MLVKQAQPKHADLLTKKGTSIAISIALINKHPIKQQVEKHSFNQKLISIHFF
ncbi:hypothetical protein VRC15_22040 [Erwinia aphidicola]|uniref:hypothetical protein n=1 Tax=Erwinia aphidicola TaxID=68334 RepID=UPI0030D0DE42